MYKFIYLFLLCSYFIICLADSKYNDEYSFYENYECVCNIPTEFIINSILYINISDFSNEFNFESQNSYINYYVNFYDGYNNYTYCKCNRFTYSENMSCNACLENYDLICVLLMITDPITLAFYICIFIILFFINKCIETKKKPLKKEEDINLIDL